MVYSDYINTYNYNICVLIFFAVFTKVLSEPSCLDPGIFQAGSCEQQDLWEDSPGVLFGNRNEFYNIYYNIYLFIYLNEYYIYIWPK